MFHNIDMHMSIPDMNFIKHIIITYIVSELPISVMFTSIICIMYICIVYMLIDKNTYITIHQSNSFVLHNKIS